MSFAVTEYHIDISISEPARTKLQSPVTTIRRIVTDRSGDMDTCLLDAV